jgi:hypothetical protein
MEVHRQRERLDFQLIAEASVADVEEWPTRIAEAVGLCIGSPTRNSVRPSLRCHPP